jgi:diguanylate cyclase (GGDEF)-like protein/PAS domain S-box-containing protein
VASQSADFSRRKGERFTVYLVPGLAALLVIILFSLAIANLASSREFRLRETARAAHQLTRTLEDRATQSLRGVDAGLSAITNAWRDPEPLQPGRTPMLQLLAESAARLPAVKALAISDLNGTLTWQSESLPTALQNFAGHDFFENQRSSPDRLLLGKPLPDQGGAELVVSRRLSDAQGRFGGVVAAFLDLKAFEEFLKSVELGETDAAIVLHEGGELIARAPAAPTWIGAPASDRLTRETLDRQAGDQTFLGSSPIDSVTRVSAARRVAGWPLIVQVGLGQESALAGWHRDRRLMLTVMMAFALAVIALALWLTRELLRRGDAPRDGIGDGRILQQVLAALPVGVQISDSDGLPLLGNAEAGRPWPIIGHQPRTASILKNGESNTRPDLPGDVDDIGGHEVFDFETGGGERKTLLGTRTPLFDAGQKIIGDISVFEEVSEVRSMQATLRETEARLQALFKHGLDGVLITRGDDSIIYANEQARILLGRDDSELDSLGLAGLTEPGKPQLRTLIEERERVGSAQGELRLRHKDGSWIPVEVTTSEYRDRAGAACAVWIVHDLSEQRRAEEQIEYLAGHDLLTGVPNRAHFQRAAEKILAAAGPGNECALLLVDLDRFKHVNEMIGHEAGDQLLKQVAARLHTCLREGDILARLGGDEFVILMRDAAAPEAVSAVARKILETTSSPLIIDDHEFLVTASIGISRSPDEGNDVRSLLRNSDIAMYRAKDAGRNGFQYFSSSMNPEARDRLTTEFALRGALERKEFAIHFQPKVNVFSSTVAGMEALVRWHNPEKGLMQPSDFIGIAEETGVIGPIGDWVLREACVQGQILRDAGHLPLKVSVNLSARQLFDQGFAQRVTDTLEETGFPANCLELEITESMIMRDAPNSILVLQALRDTGVRIAIDDFGTGYSSLAYLKRFPIDCIKIDRSFIRDLPQDRDDASITRGIIAMAHNMKLEVVAEGVETVAQLEFLRAHGCDEIQGFLFSEPLVMVDFEKYLGKVPSASVH